MNGRFPALPDGGLATSHPFIALLASTLSYAWLSPSRPASGPPDTSAFMHACKRRGPGQMLQAYRQGATLAHRPAAARGVQVQCKARRVHGRRTSLHGRSSAAVACVARCSRGNRPGRCQGLVASVVLLPLQARRRLFSSRNSRLVSQRFLGVDAVLLLWLHSFAGRRGPRGLLAKGWAPGAATLVLAS